MPVSISFKAAIDPSPQLIQYGPYQTDERACMKRFTGDKLHQSRSLRKPFK